MHQPGPVADPVAQFTNAFQADDAAEVRRLLEGHPELKAKINEVPGTI
jgi:hypothetical protein